MNVGQNAPESNQKTPSPAIDWTDGVREALAVTLRGCEELLPQADWAQKLSRSERTGVPIPEAEIKPQQSAAANAADARAGWAGLFTVYLVPAIVIGFVSAFCLLLVYSLNTWLPKIMVAGGYPLGSSLMFLVTLNLGATVGALGGGWLADRWGCKPTLILFFALAVVSLCTLGVKPGPVLLNIMLLIAGATGVNFTPTVAQAGQQIRVVVSYTDNGNTLESLTSAATAVLAGIMVMTTFGGTLTGTSGAEVMLGSDGVVEKLKAKGYKVERVCPGCKPKR